MPALIIDGDATKAMFKSTAWNESLNNYKLGGHREKDSS